MPAAVVLTVATVAAALVTGAGPRFYPDDPVWVERDHQDASAVRPWQINLTGEIVTALFGKPGDPAADVRAQNVNTVDEVPDSSWFTNRVGQPRADGGGGGQGAGYDERTGAGYLDGHVVEVRRHHAGVHHS